MLLFGDCTLDPERRELSRASGAVSVGPQVFDLLLFLVENRTRVVSKDDLLGAVWHGRIVSESTITSHINAVRAAIGDNGREQRFIRTVARKGFRFIAPRSRFKLEQPRMIVATYNVNGVNGRLPVLLRWLAEAKPDILCLQELKAPQERFPIDAIRQAGFSAIWHGQKSWNGVAILSRGAPPVETRRGLPGDPDDVHSRYIEAEIGDLVIGCLYLPNGNPWPGPKFDYKLRWFERFIDHAKKHVKSGRRVILAGDFNVMPTELDVYKPERWIDDALFRVEVRSAYAKLIKQGWTDAVRQANPGQRIYTFWDYFRNAYARNAGLRIDHILLSSSIADRLVAAGVDRHARGWEKTSDHAPTWIILEEEPSKTRRASKASSNPAPAKKRDAREQGSPMSAIGRPMPRTVVGML